MNPVERGLDDDRMDYLATGFALNELSQDELQELYDAVRQPGDEGLRAARITWNVLGSTVDLRSVLSRQFQDTVRHRVAAGGSGEADARPDGFVGAVLDRLGLSRPRLREVAIPALAGRRSAFRRAVLILAAGAAVAVVAALAAAGRTPGAVARVASLRGRATVEGRALAAGSELDRRPIVVSPASELAIAWPEQSSAVVSGPANVYPQGTGISVSSGVAWIRSAAPFTVGLPDMQVALEAGASLAAEVRDNRSVVAVNEGVATLATETGHGEALDPGTAAGSDVRFSLRSATSWRDNGRTLAFEYDPRAVAWQFEATVEWQAPGDIVVLDLGGEAGTYIRLEPGLVLLPNSAGGGRLELPGAPLLAPRIKIRASPGVGPELSVEGLRRPATLGVAGNLRAVRLLGRVRLKGVAFNVGPPPEGSQDRAAAAGP